MNFRLILFLFLIWRVFDFLIIIFSKNFIPYLGFFPYKEQLFSFNLPSWLTPLSNFDGIHYLLIAKNGYQTHEQAFFPLYPLLIKFLAPLFFNNFFLSAFFISNLSFLLALYFFSLYLKEIGLKKSVIAFFTILILIYPTSFFFGAIYTEGLFFLFLSLTLYFLEKNRAFLAAIFAFFASLTRLIGVFLVMPIFFKIISKPNLLTETKKQKFSVIRFILYITLPFFGLFLYCFYLWQTTGDPFYFFTSQPAFGANRSTSLVFLPQIYFRYLKIFYSAQFNFQYFIALIEFFIFTFVFLILIFDFFQILKINKTPNIQYRISNINLFSLNLFSLANLILPTLTGTFSSIPRYSLFSLSFFIFLAKIKSNFLKFFLLFFFFILHIILLAFFSQGYFVS